MLLEWAEVPFIVHPSDADETLEGSPTPESFATTLSFKKASTVFDSKVFSLEDHVFVGADTIVVLEDEILGKPIDREDAIGILKMLSGKTHLVITGVTILSSEKQIQFFEKTEVTFEILSSYQIEHYVDHYAPYDKAGAYAIQEWIGVTGIKSIHGDFYNVMGLPINRLVRLLKDEFHFRF